MRILIIRQASTLSGTPRVAHGPGTPKARPRSGGADRLPKLSGRQVYSGYAIRRWKREVVDGVPVPRVIMYPSHDRSGGRASSYLSFGLAAFVAGSMATRRNWSRDPGPGRIFLPGGAFALTSAILECASMTPDALDEMARRGRAFYHGELTLACGEERIAAVFRQMWSR